MSVDDILASNPSLDEKTVQFTLRQIKHRVGPYKGEKVPANLTDRVFSVPEAFVLNDGNVHPIMGYGTYKVGIIPGSAGGAGGVAKGNPAEAKAIVDNAIAAGYRMFDCAEFYENERFVGEALANCGIPRKQLYIVSKVWTTTIAKGSDAVKAQVEKTLKDLQTDYIDLYLIHWPVPVKHIEAFRALVELRKLGKIRSVGVSNYTVEDYKELIQAVGVAPAVNQIEINPFLFRKETLAFFQSQGVLTESYRSLRNGKAFKDPTLLAMAAKYKRAVSQILGRWCLQRGCVYMPKSVNRDRMEQNAKVLDFQLSAEDMQTLDSLTTKANIEEFKGHYTKNCVRDTPLEGKGAALKGSFTAN